MTESNSAESPPIASAITGFFKKITTRSQAGGLTTGLFTLASSLVAVVIALAICAILLLVTGKDPLAAYKTILTTGLKG